MGPSRGSESAVNQQPAEGCSGDQGGCYSHLSNGRHVIHGGSVLVHFSVAGEPMVSLRMNESRCTARQVDERPCAGLGSGANGAAAGARGGQPWITVRYLDKWLDVATDTLPRQSSCWAAPAPPAACRFPPAAPAPPARHSPQDTWAMSGASGGWHNTRSLPEGESNIPNAPDRSRPRPTNHVEDLKLAANGRWRARANR
jgi:hypothetical protein